MDTEIKSLLEQQGKAWAEFKASNDAREAEIKKLGAADVVLTEKVDRLNDQISKYEKTAEDLHKKAMERMEFLAKPASSNGDQPSEADRQHAKAFSAFLRKGQDADLNDLQSKAMNVSNEPDGGYLVPSALSNRIIQRLRLYSPMRDLATIETISTDALEIPLDTGEADAGWVGELAARPETNTPQVGKSRIPTQELYAQPKVTQKLLDDAMWDIESWLSNKVADKFARKEGTAFVSGNGVGQPRGFASYATTATADASRAWGTFEHVATGTAGGFGSTPNGSDKILDVIHKIHPAYLPNSRWAMSRATLAEARKLRDADGAYLFVPSFIAGMQSTLMGYPIAIMDDMASITTDSLSIAFGDFSQAYTIVDRTGIRTLRDPYTEKGFVKFYTTKRVGGDVVNFDALKFVKFGTT